MGIIEIGFNNSREGSEVDIVHRNRHKSIKFIQRQCFVVAGRVDGTDGGVGGCSWWWLKRIFLQISSAYSKKQRNTKQNTHATPQADRMNGKKLIDQME